MPIAAGLFLVGQEAISFVFERGKFTEADTYNTYLALMFYLPIIITQGLQYIVSKSMYAQGKTAIVFRISVTTIALNIFLNWLLVKPFGYPGLALSSAFVSLYYLTMTIIFVYKDFPVAERVKLLKLIVKVLIPTFIMVVPIYLLKTFIPISKLYSLWQLAIIIPIGVVLYLIGLFIFYREAFNELFKVIKSKAKKAK
jgi:putative peptidoglycan lipid II flippase